jgi:hypothetical protein
MDRGGKSLVMMMMMMRGGEKKVEKQQRELGYGESWEEDKINKTAALEQQQKS